MPIRKRDKLMFVHIPKCAGSSIEVFFDMQKPECLFEKKNSINENGVSYAPQHMTAKMLKNRISDFDDYFRFTFVRNPYHRVVSEYYFRFRFVNNRTLSVKDFSLWFDRFYANIDTDHKLHQHEYIFDGGVCLVPFIGKVENINNDFSVLLDNIGYVNGGSLNEINTSKKIIPYSDLLIDEMKSKIYNLYKKDFKVFGYDA